MKTDFYFWQIRLRDYVDEERQIHHKSIHLPPRCVYQQLRGTCQFWQEAQQVNRSLRPPELRRNRGPGSIPLLEDTYFRR
ncbi:hypothetical protein PILCRDRAFT_825792 [Piloderma croceum F 1598]|uniref:Uncharacterized protein n=1 Tax=Piloderma croceum (strain F 1598) TaxID=765440 RepID=A0A0C3EWZ2_PILCF|nr:hypothetical protein PILCRDRAFT_825792 [Piloderma croceum F 1598]